MIENIKARLFSVRFNIWTEKIDPNSRDQEWYYNGQLYFGHPCFTFFLSGQNSWFKDSHNNPINQNKATYDNQ